MDASVSAEAPSETAEEMETRHSEELRELEGRVKAMLTGVKKSQRAEMEFKTTQMEYELKARQREEEVALEELTERLEGLLSPAADDGGTDEEGERMRKQKAAQQREAERLEREAAAAQARIAKAHKKKDKSKTAAAERDKVKEDISANAGPSLRQLELEAINLKLGSEEPALRVREIISDGNCLYRAVADQLRFTAPAASPAAAGSLLDFAALRALAAEHMQQHSEDYAPFLGLDAAGPEYAAYLAAVRRAAGEVEWGGQLEIRAMCAALRRCVLVYDAAAPVLAMGEEFRTNGPELRLAYHRHYFSLGEHYNSVEFTA